MRLENLLALTGATLANEPCVNSFENIVFDASKLKRGDLYIAFDNLEIKLAVENGAYGIIYDKKTPLIDEEIAWIKVESVREALDKLLRFRLIESDIIAYECDEIVLKLARQIVTDSNFLVLSTDAKKIFKQLWQIENRSTILFCPDIHNKNIFTNVKTINSTSREHINIIEQTLFETSFIYNNKYYERQLISPFFIPYLEELFHLYSTLNINYRLRKFTTLDNFEAVFTNKNLEVKDFGASDKVLIFEKNSSLIHKEIEFLQRNASWANIIYIIPSQIDTQDNTNIFKYEKNEEILDILKENKFHFALVVGVDKSILNNSSAKQTQLLFDL